MVCANCKQEAVKNNALGKDFFYCRNCKIEVSKVDGSLLLSDEELDEIQKMVDDVWRVMSKVSL
jgi:hypothetical protein